MPVMASPEVWTVTFVTLPWAAVTAAMGLCQPVLPVLRSGLRALASTVDPPLTTQRRYRALWGKPRMCMLRAAYACMSCADAAASAHAVGVDGLSHGGQQAPGIASAQAISPLSALSPAADWPKRQQCFRVSASGSQPMGGRGV